MKNLILIFALALFSTNLHSQDITYFFLNLPDSSLGLSKEERKKIVKNHSDEMVMIGYNSFMFNKVDEKYGYLIGSFDASVNLKFWEISNGDKLIAIHGWNGSIGICYSEFHFYNYSGKEFKLLNNEDVLPIVVEENFLSDNYEDNLKRIREDFFYSCIIESISPESLNITVNHYLVNHYLVGDTENYEEYGIIGNKMELIWNDGKFTKGKVYWREKE